MKKLLLTAIILASLTTFSQGKKAKSLAPVNDKMMETAVIYEVNIRQYSKEGTFNAFAKDLPELKKLGVKILWFMPIHPIGVEKRKEGLGSYYSVKDYRGINPEFGTLADFQALVKKAHANGMYVIIDWVPNHSAWDNPMVKEHPEYYAKDKDGKMISPFDWTDVVKFDYSNKNLRKTMTDNMIYWLKDQSIDGFRCDVAMEVPEDYWQECRAALNKIKPNFMLMEAEQPNFMKNNSFDMQYGWELHSIMNKIYKGEKSVVDFDKYIEERKVKYQKDDFEMIFTSNHDENSWNGTEYERMGNAVETFTALTYIAKGMPLIYNGQEYDFNRRLKFFEKDEIEPKTKTKMFSVYEKLGKLKINNPALNGGKNPASYTRIKTSSDEKVLAFVREKGGKKVFFVGNLSKEEQTFTAEFDGAMIDYMDNNKILIRKGQKFIFKPWEYKVFVKHW